jgi:hypothetical protein
MKSIVKTTLLFVAMVVSRPSARAQTPHLLFDGCQWSFPKLCDLWQQRKHWCPDDYCPKSSPCITPNASSCRDDYCPKKLPCVPPNPNGCLDDYRCKTCPILLRSNCEPWYACGPMQNCMKSGCGKTAQ